ASSSLATRPPAARRCFVGRPMELVPTNHGAVVATELGAKVPENLHPRTTHRKGIVRYWQVSTAVGIAPPAARHCLVGRPSFLAHWCSGAPIES
ncbi:unnamed protein product, partial [Urochloa humidicola]